MPPFDRTTDPSLRALEALRGYASVIVVFHHFALAFLPGLKTAMDHPVLAYSLGWLLNGMGAVYLFFLLSGFVLTLKYYQTPDVKILLSAAVKRLPRLWPSALYGTLLGYLALRFALNANSAAADLSGSDWLRSFADADQTLAPNLALALRESLTMFLHYRPLHYNTNLWTMLIEFYGSLLAFFAAFVLTYVADNRLVVVKIGLALILL
ncbi:MAG: acyltransferase family protein, partial [Cypionkella sp.]